MSKRLKRDSDSDGDIFCGDVTFAIDSNSEFDEVEDPASSPVYLCPSTSIIIEDSQLDSSLLCIEEDSNRATSQADETEAAGADNAAINIGGLEDDVDSRIKTQFIEIEAQKENPDSWSTDDEDHEDYIDYTDAASVGSDFFDSDDGELSIKFEGNFPIYKDAPINLEESMLCTLAYTVRHNLSGAATEDLLHLIKLHCRTEDNAMIGTLYLFKKYFSDLTASVKHHYFCSICYSTLDDEKSICVNTREHKTKAKVSFFLEMSLDQQIKALFQRKNFEENIGHRFKRKKVSPDAIEDIYDGELYKQFVERGFLSEKNKHNISFTLNTDGVPVFKSSKTSMWPIYFSVNELPIKMRFRKDYMLLGGIWYGSKPLPNLMMKPFIESLKHLRKGIQVELFGSDQKYICKAMLLAGTGDLPAKADFMGIKHASDSHSCLVCKIEGKSVKASSTALPNAGPGNVDCDGKCADHKKNKLEVFGCFHILKALT